MIQQYNLQLPAFKRGFHIIDEFIEDAITDWPKVGICHIFIKHTSAALAINEGADATVRTDMENIFNKLVPENEPFYNHNSEGSDDMPAHAKAVIAGASVSIPITNAKLNLGTWQSIYLCEFRNSGGRRNIVITIYA